MSENKYHINYKTGNPGVCKAKIKCPFGADMLVGHYDTKEEAREFYEDYMSKPKSEGARLVIEFYDVEQELFKRDSQGEDISELLLLAEKRDAYKALLRADYEGDQRPNSLEPHVNNTNISFELEKFEFSNENIVVGLPNDVIDIQRDRPGLIETAEKASKAWVEGLTDKEIDAVRSYAIASDDYSKNMAASEKNETIKNLHIALNKAPKIPNTHVYSGLSQYTKKVVLDAIEKEGDIFTVNKALSTTLNPPQINGFIGHTNDSNDMVQEKIALEIETNEGASMNVISGNPQEMEILIPPGKYELITERKNVSFLWEENGKGRTADRVLRLKRLDSE